MKTARFAAAAAMVAAAVLPLARQGFAADPTHGKINHILILMLENRTFDSYLGQLGTKGIYGTCKDDSPHPGCAHDAVDGLDCTVDVSNNYTCTNSNPKNFLDPTGPSCVPDPAPLDMFKFNKPNMTPVQLTQPGLPRLDSLLDPHCYEGVEVF
jgi:hypothetical protein